MYVRENYDNSEQPLTCHKKNLHSIRGKIEIMLPINGHDLQLIYMSYLSSAYILATAPVYDPTELSRANRVATVQRTLSRPDPDLATLSRQLMCMHHGAIWCLDTHQ